MLRYSDVANSEVTSLYFLALEMTVEQRLYP